MTKICVLGGTGYAGGAIAREAAGRGLEVVVFSRSTPDDLPAGAKSVTGSALARGDVARAASGADVIVVALAPNGDLETSFAEVNAEIADVARILGARLGVVGGAGSLLVEPGGSKLYETEQFPDRFKEFARASDAVLEALRGSDPDLDWFVLSPPHGFGHYAPGVPTGQFRIGRDVLLSTADGRSEISGADFAQAFVDEIEHPVHRRERFTVAY
ncbi:NAD(P)-dependent oxidoreductase [Amycolatopsis sp. cmx-4-83]|uniref:NAD(P)-dependent oxidoreductase n=1 Tax=Amycolatopsis sp. cmx-4-83 TaxID=2790940 RepID=UPI00397A1660